jgi:hypothetical protein
MLNSDLRVPVCGVLYLLFAKGSGELCSSTSQMKTSGIEFKAKKDKKETSLFLIYPR